MLKTGQLREMWVVASQTHLQFNAVWHQLSIWLVSEPGALPDSFFLPAGCIHGVLLVACNHGSLVCADPYKACIPDQLSLLQTS